MRASCSAAIRFCEVLIMQRTPRGGRSVLFCLRFIFWQEMVVFYHRKALLAVKKDYIKSKNEDDWMNAGMPALSVFYTWKQTVAKR